MEKIIQHLIATLMGAGWRRTWLRLICCPGAASVFDAADNCDASSHQIIKKQTQKSFSEGYGELLIDAYPYPGAEKFHGVSLVSGGWALLPREWNAAWLSEAEHRHLDSPSFCHRTEHWGSLSQCFSRSGQSQHCSSSSTHTHIQIDNAVYDHILQDPFLCYARVNNESTKL